MDTEVRDVTASYL